MASSPALHGPALNSDVLGALLAEADPAVSIFVPIDPAGADPHAPAAALRRLAGEAETILQRRGTGPERIAAAMASMQGAMAGLDFARHRDPGLALFVSTGLAHVLPLPKAPPAEAVVVGRHFHIKPLLPALAHGRLRFNILALSAGNARLLSATAYAWEELPLDALPPEVEATAIAMEDAAHAAGTPAAPEELRHSLVVEQLRTMAYAVRKRLADDPAPLVLVAEPQAAGHFRKLAAPHLHQLQAEELHTNPFAMTDAELHARVAAVMAPALDAELSRALGQIEARLGTAEPNVAIRLEEILAAAHEGRVDTVVVAEDETLWGHFDPATGTLTAHGTQGRDEEDLVNEAAVATLRTGGRAFALPHAHMPRRSPAAALLRF